ncbi:MAG: hypothetical protein KAQ93_06095 [Spirochaetales bacterium]|nr:hypothetical protein [Spirochaetales bacterium]
MNILKQYQVFISRIIKIRTFILLTGLIILINTLIFPLLNTQGVKLLDTRFYYSHEEAANYVLQLEQNEKLKSQFMHGTVDIIYPVIYTLLLSCIIFYLNGSIRLISLPLLVLAADLLENLSIILILIISRQNIFYTTFSTAASIATPVKWSLILVCLSVIIYLIIYLAVRRIHEK